MGLGIEGMSAVPVLQHSHEGHAKGLITQHALQAEYAKGTVRPPAVDLNM